MKELIKTTKLYRALLESGAEFFTQAVLAIFPDGVYLESYLKACAKLFFRAEEGTRISDLIDKGIYSDLLLFPTEKKYTVDMCAEILEESMLLPVEGEKKLFVLSDFQTANALVQNKLLKLLEEPPHGVCFLVGATSSSPILPTVLSRVKLIHEPPFPQEEILKALSRNHAGDRALGAAAAACGGCYSMAERLSSGGDQFSLAEKFLKNLDYAACEEAEKKKAPLETVSALRAILRELYFAEKGFEKYLTGVAPRELYGKFPAGVILTALGELDRIETDLNFNANFANCLLALALKIKEETDKWKRLP